MKSNSYVKFYIESQIIVLILTLGFQIVDGGKPIVSLHLAKSVCQLQRVYGRTGQIQNPVKSRTDATESGSQFGCGWFVWHERKGVYSGKSCKDVGEYNTGFKDKEKSSKLRLLGDSSKRKCVKCESSESNNSSLACKNEPETAAIVFCNEGEICRTLTYTSKSGRGRVLSRGCFDPYSGVRSIRKNKKSEHCRYYPPYFPEPCEGEDCDFGTCECTCDSHVCNNVVYSDDGWDGCKSLED